MSREDNVADVLRIAADKTAVAVEARELVAGGGAVAEVTIVFPSGTRANGRIALTAYVKKELTAMLPTLLVDAVGVIENDAERARREASIALVHANEDVGVGFGR